MFVFAAFIVLSELFPVAGLVLALALMAITPILVVRSLAFNHRMSAYRNNQFRFDASYGEAVMALLVWPILGMLTAGILYSYAILKIVSLLFETAATAPRPLILTPRLGITSALS